MTTSMHTFAADGLLDRYGFGSGDMPGPVYNHLFTMHGRTAADDADVAWRSLVVIPVVRDLLIPALPVEVEYVTSPCTGDNPILVHTLNGKMPARWKGMAYAYNLLANYEVTLPVNFLADLLRGVATLDGLDGVPLPDLNAAVAAGITVTEIPALYAAGALDPDALAALHGLRA